MIGASQVDWADGADELKLELGEAQKLRTADLDVRVDPRAEWREVFADAWRQVRPSIAMD